MGPPGLDDAGEALGHLLEGGDERLDGGVDVGDELLGDGDADRRRHRVVRRLRGVDVVVGVHVTPEGPAGERRQHLVDVHVRRRARTRLVHVDGELLVELARLDAPGRFADRRRHVLVDARHAERAVDRRGVALDHRQSASEADVERTIGDGEVADRQVRLLAPELFHPAHSTDTKPTYSAAVPWRTYEAVLFDLDGVLTPTAELHQRAWTRMFDEFLVPRRRGSVHGG